MSLRESSAVEAAGPEAVEQGEHWPLLPFRFKPLKHNPVVSGLALSALKLRTRRLERVIFTATTGRSGTLTLARIFGAVRGCAAVHEPYPIMNGAVLRAASYGDVALIDRVYRQIKAINVRRVAAGHRYYLEANHLFVKTFIRNAADDFGDRLAVIHLVRPATEVATSIYCLRDYPGTERGNYWWLDYRAPSNMISMVRLLEEDPEFSHPFYKGLWYWHEIETRVAFWREHMPMLKMIRFETAWLNDLPKICDLLAELGIQYESAMIEGVVGAREHGKTDQKVDAPLATARANEMSLRFLELLRARRIPGYC